MSDWIHDLRHSRERGERAVLVSVVSTKGSAPRAAGTRMVVGADRVAGTIGGGNLELQAIGIARDLLSNEAEGELKRFPLGASLGQCCGGLVNLLFEPVDPDAGWLDVLENLRRTRTAVVVATTAERATQGKLLVTADAASGTLGNAALDADIVTKARAMLASGAGAQLVRMSADPSSAATLVFLDPMRDPDFPIVLFGAGHVGRALAAALAHVDCRITWVDERAEELPAQVPANVTVVVTDTPEAEVAAAPAGAYFLVMTHSHPLDQALAECILKRGDFAYFGLIGSVSKRRQFERRMAQRGIAPERFAAMTCPIGVPGIKGKEPATIAIAVAAQLLQIREATLAASHSAGAVAHG